MKIAVFSDSHGNASDMRRVLCEYAPDMAIHLGDGRRDIEELHDEFPQICVCTVSGNCDGDWPEGEKRVVTLGAHKAFLTHGHRYGVRFAGLEPLLYAAECSDCDIAMYGHTHSAFCENVGGILVINPGSVGQGANRSWARLEIDGDDLRCEIVPCGLQASEKLI